MKILSLLLVVLLAFVATVSAQADPTQLLQNLQKSLSAPQDRSQLLGSAEAANAAIDAASSLVQTHASTSASAAEGDEFGSCKTCVFVLERIKKGSNMLLPAICSELYHKYPDAYALCHQVLNALSINGNNVRYWLFEGCFKYEIYQSKEWIKPCPSHVMCSVLKDLSAKPFCPALPMEDPFDPAHQSE
jgi:hypothetical protein